MFILQHHLQHLIIGFRMCSKIQLLTLDTGEATALWKKFQKMKQNLSKISVFFCHFFTFCLVILMCIRAFWVLFLQSYTSKELNSYIVTYTHHINVFSWGKISLPNRVKQI